MQLLSANSVQLQAIAYTHDAAQHRVFHVVSVARLYNVHLRGHVFNISAAKEHCQQGQGELCDLLETTFTTPIGEI